MLCVHVSDETRLSAFGLSAHTQYANLVAAYLGASDILLIWDGRLNKGQYGGRRGCFVLASSNEDNYSSFKKGG